MPPEVPSVNVPVLFGANALVIDEPLPVKVRLPTLLSTLKAVTSTSPDKVAFAAEVNVNVPTLAIAPLALILAPPLSKLKLLLPPAIAPSNVIAPSLLVLLVSMVISPVLIVVPVTVTELPELLSVVMLPFKVTLVEPVMATVLMLPLPPMAPTATVLAEPPVEVMVTSRDPEAAVMVPILIAPPAELTLKF